CSPSFPPSARACLRFPLSASWLSARQFSGASRGSFREDWCGDFLTSRNLCLSGDLISRSGTSHPGSIQRPLPALDKLEKFLRTPHSAEGCLHGSLAKPLRGLEVGNELGRVRMQGERDRRKAQGRLLVRSSRGSPESLSLPWSLLG